MLTANFILSKLPPYLGTNEILKKSQSIADIKEGIMSSFELDKKEYAAIAPYFVGKTITDTCKNVFNFLRNNVKNVTEGINVQSVKSPAAIIATGTTTGSDCKNYALFVGGVLDAINRSGVQKIPIAFRFCKYQQWDNSFLDHVFIVAYPNKKNEVWIDCIKDVPYFNHKKYPYSFTDKKINSMALVRMSGQNLMSIEEIKQGLIAEKNRRVNDGSILVGSPKYNQYINAIAKMGDRFTPPPEFNPQLNEITLPNGGGVANIFSNIFSKSGSATPNLSNDLNLNTAVQAAASFIPGGSEIAAAVTSLFTTVFGKNPDPNDWQGWDNQTRPKGQPDGTSAAWWVINDGDSPSNESLNILSYMKNNSDGINKVFNAAKTVYNLNAAQFAAKLVEKLNRTGFSSEAAQFNQVLQPKNSYQNSSENSGKNYSSNGNNNMPATGSNSKTIFYIGGAIVAAKLLKIF